MKKMLSVLVFAASLIFVGSVYAYDLTLTKIGSMSTIGADYSLVSYIGAVPALEGTATPAAQVAVKIQTATAYVIAATASGVWTYTPTSLSTGDNTVTITSGTQQLSFVLRFNSTATSAATSTSSASITALPETGPRELLIIGSIAGVGVWYLGRYLKKRMYRWESGK